MLLLYIIHIMIPNLQQSHSQSSPVSSELQHLRSILSNQVSKYFFNHIPRYLKCPVNTKLFCAHSSDCRFIPFLLSPSSFPNILLLWFNNTNACVDFFYPMFNNKHINFILLPMCLYTSKKIVSR